MSLFIKFNFIVDRHLSLFVFIFHFHTFIRVHLPPHSSIHLSMYSCIYFQHLFSLIRLSSLNRLKSLTRTSRLQVSQPFKRWIDHSLTHLYTHLTNQSVDNSHAEYPNPFLFPIVSYFDPFLSFPPIHVYQLISPQLFSFSLQLSRWWRGLSICVVVSIQTLCFQRLKFVKNPLEKRWLWCFDQYIKLPTRESIR